MAAAWVCAAVSVLTVERVHWMVGELVDSGANIMVVFESGWTGAVA